METYHIFGGVKPDGNPHHVAVTPLALRETLEETGFGPDGFFPTDSTNVDFVGIIHVDGDVSLLPESFSLDLT